MDWIKVASAQELGEDEVKTVTVAGRAIALYCLQGQYFATDAFCTHGQALLSEGFVEDGCIECPLHQGRFDIRTGKAMCAPVTADLRTHDVKRLGDGIFVMPAAKP